MHTLAAKKENAYTLQTLQTQNLPDKGASQSDGPSQASAGQSPTFAGFLWGFRVSGCLGFRVSGFQGFRVSGFRVEGL